MFKPGDQIFIARGGKYKGRRGVVLSLHPSKYSRLPHQVTDLPKLDAKIQCKSGEIVFRDIYYLEHFTGSPKNTQLDRLRRVASGKGEITYTKKSGYVFVDNHKEIRLGRDCVHALFILEKVLKEVS